MVPHLIEEVAILSEDDSSLDPSPPKVLIVRSSHRPGLGNGENVDSTLAEPFGDRTGDVLVEIEPNLSEHRG